MRDLAHMVFSPQVVVLAILVLILLVVILGIIWIVFFRQ